LRFFGKSTTAENTMNKKLITLAVAAAMAAPAAALAEATLYGKLHVSIDYADVNNAILPVYESITATRIYPADEVEVVGTDTAYFFNGGSGDIAFVDDTGAVMTLEPGVLQSIDSDVLGPLPDSVDLVRVDSAGRPILAERGRKFKGWGISKGNGYIPGASRANRIGVKGSEDLGGGLKAVYQVEFGVNLSDTNNNVVSNSDAITMRNSFVGLAGGFGTFLVGRHDTPLKISTGKLDMFSDTMADYNGTVGFQDLRADNAIAYVSPNWSGFQFIGAAIAPGGATALGVRNTETDSIAEAWSIAAIYSNGPFYASAAYEVLGKDHFMTQATQDAGAAGCLGANGLPTLSCGYVDDDFTKYRFGLGLLDWNGFSLTAIYENQDNIPAGQTRTALWTVDPNGMITAGSVQDGFISQNLYQIQAGYSFGNNTIKAMYGWMDRDNEKAFGATRESVSLANLRRDFSGDANTWAIAFDHNFSKRTRAYALYTNVSDDRKDNPFSRSLDWSGFSLGMIHSF
jgi:predicted porin